MLRRALGVVFVVLLFTGCSSSSDDVVRVESPPGTRLHAGFVVAPGSRLIGPVFVFSIDNGLGPSWLALMDIRRDPLAVYDDYVAQGRRLGIPLPGSGTSARFAAPATCHLVVKDHWAPVGTTDPATADSVACYGAGLLREDKGSVVLQSTWGGASHHAMLEIFQSPVEGEGLADLGTERAAKLVPLPQVADRPLVSEPGAPFGIAHNAFEVGYRRFTLEPGSHIVADVTGMTDGLVVVLRVDGDAQKVLAGYARQLGKGGTTPRVRRERTPDGEVFAVDNSPEGGGHASLLTDPTGRWLLIRANSD